MKKLWNLLRRLFGRKKTYCQFQAVTVLATRRGLGPNVIVPILFRRPTPEQFQDFMAKADKGDDKADALLLARHALCPHDKLADYEEDQ